MDKKINLKNFVYFLVVGFGLGLLKFVLGIWGMFVGLMFFILFWNII